MANTKSSTTPPGTPPMPTKRSTKHKRVAYGRELQEKAAIRRADRATAAKEAAITVARLQKIVKPTDAEKAELAAAILKAGRKSQHRHAAGYVVGSGHLGKLA